MANLLTLLLPGHQDLRHSERGPKLLMVQKTMVVVEGVCRTLDPNFDMWSAAESLSPQRTRALPRPPCQMERPRNGMGVLPRLLLNCDMLAERAERCSAEMDRMAISGNRLT